MAVHQRPPLGVDARRILHVVRGHLLRAERGQRDRVARVEAADHEEQVEEAWLDEGVLSRFWASLNQPLKPAIQCWTTIPIWPSGETGVTRVLEKDVRFFDLNKLNRVQR